jgi:adenosylhomocysteine nucleosidase
MIKTAIIAALERELRPLVKGWSRSPLESGGRRLVVHRNGEVIAVAGGIGSHGAELAARAVVKQFHPQVLISAGLAGALIRSLKVRSVVTPNVVVDAANGAEYRCNTSGDVVGGGVLVSAAEIAGMDSKLNLVERFHGLVVDMEAAGVAKVATESNIAFRCIKAISDELDFAMPPLNQFVDSGGNFSTASFVAWAAVRPGQWLPILRLARNSSRAAAALCLWLRKNVAGAAPPPGVVTLERAEYSDSTTRKDALDIPHRHSVAAKGALGSRDSHAVAPTAGASGTPDSHPVTPKAGASGTPDSKH